MRKKLLKEILPKWLGKKYKLGEIDCLQLFIELYNLPATYEGFILSGENKNYMEFWEQDEKAFTTFLNFIYDNFTEVKDLQIGDLLLFDWGAGINIGNNTVLVVMEGKGCRTVTNIWNNYIVFRRIP